MSVDLQFLEKYDFVHSHEIILTGEWPTFQSKKLMPKEASVYMWLQPISSSHFEVLYIGKAGYGVDTRFSQHSGGFKNNKTGKSNKQLIQELLSQGHRIFVYSRVSASQQVFQANLMVPLYSVEEEALCEQFNPLWNRAKFPKKSKKEPSKKEETLDESNEDVDQKIDFSDLAYGSEAKFFYESLDLNEQRSFLQMLGFIADTPEFSRLQQKIVGQYTSLAPGYSGIPILNFALLHESGRAVANSWGVRIPLVSAAEHPLTAFFPKKYLNPSCPEDLIEWGSSGSFRPKNLTHFLYDPSIYLVL
jgi:hypothetical protein